MTVIGKYNDNTTSNNLFVVGNGTDNNNRKNIFEVKNDGYINCEGIETSSNVISNSNIICEKTLYVKTIKNSSGNFGFYFGYITVYLNMGAGDEMYNVYAQVIINDLEEKAMVTSGTIYANKTTQANQAFALINFTFNNKIYELNAIQKIQENGGTICLSANNWQCTDKLTVNSLKYNGPNYGWANFHTVYPVGTWPAYQFCGSLFHIESIINI